MPLFLLVVQTSVNFQVVAIIVLEEESSELIMKALNIVRSWNPEINPKYAMVDFDAGEILSLEDVFPGILVFLCDFHREQSWNRWVNKKENGVFMIADDVKCRLRRIAKASNEEMCKKAMADFRSWEHYGMGKLSAYFENTWYPERTRWCRSYRPNDLFRCNTNNGTERLNESLKYGTLDGYKACTLSELMEKLIDSFIPDLYERYVSLNVQYSSRHKGYCSSIPRYMVDRPGPLVDDMLTKKDKVTPFMVSSVKAVCVVSNIFTVESISPTTNEKNMYSVKLQG